MSKVEMHSAYMWDCEKCGGENFQRAITVTLDPNDEEDKRTIDCLYGGEMPDGGEMVAQSYPDTVTCKHCKEKFETFMERGFDDEGD